MVSPMKTETTHEALRGTCALRSGVSLGSRAWHQVASMRKPIETQAFGYAAQGNPDTSALV